jgi:hypothetical protein
MLTIPPNTAAFPEMGQAHSRIDMMAFGSKPFAALALLALLGLGACATEGPRAVGYAGGYPRGDAGSYSGEPLPAEPPVQAPIRSERLTPPESVDGLLSSPPNDARPGECYAKVVVPGQPIGAPPPQPHAVWVQTPPRPGQVSPTWCIVYQYGAPQPVAWTPERYGWIRVICDKDATADRIRHIQQRLRAWGDYAGADTGRYDQTTADAVARFQAQRRIDHGGVLSVKTAEALDEAPPLVPAFDAGHPNPNAPVYPQTYAAAAPQPAYPPTVYGCGQPACQPQPAPVYQQPVYQPPIYQPPVVQTQIVRQQVIQPVITPQIIYQPIYQPTPMGCGQPACQPNPSPCGGPVCNNGWGGGYGGYGQGGYGQPGTPSYAGRLLSWPGKTQY